MNIAALSRRFRSSRTSPIILSPLYPALCTSRAASLNSAIHHGIRRSKGVGFRGKERSRTGNVSPGYTERRGPDRGYVEQLRSSRPHMRDDGSSRTSSYNSSRTEERRFGKGTLSKQERPAKWLSQGQGHGTRSTGRPTASPTTSREGTNNRKREKPVYGFNERPSNQNNTFPSLSSKDSAYKTYKASSRASYSEHESQTIQKSTSQPESQHSNSRFEDNKKLSRHYGSQDKSFGPGSNGGPTRLHGSQGGKGSANDGPLMRIQTRDNNRDDDSQSQSRIATRMPVSIPYTTPASEFLYGTSVVEAALSGRREHRRKLYKLYIYRGENRESSSVERDAGIERLAKKNSLEVVRVSGDWLRVMDKMSGGRPHNGYILEASPLPRKPVTSLGNFATTGGHPGFQISLDYQSREEAAVNGTDDFIPFSSNIPGRKPLVLLLDSIVDPGNLGGIIRTASFLGVTAIAVSTRNSASFTSVVHKASAGASENVTLLSVNKPAGFLVDSKAAGWKVFAAVAPSSRKGQDEPESLTTDELEDPLSKDPCILMLGGEGNGLRWNLQSKADATLAIRGSGRSHNVDSLNVSVAAGILIDSFLKRSNATARLSSEEEVKGLSEPAGDLF